MGKGREDQSGEGQSHGHSHAHSHTPPYQADQADKQKKGEKGETRSDHKLGCWFLEDNWLEASVNNNLVNMIREITQ